mgnify:CR=1 FL=1
MLLLCTVRFLCYTRTAVIGVGYGLIPNRHRVQARVGKAPLLLELPFHTPHNVFASVLVRTSKN